MYAQIIPLRRLPRRFAFFDYKISEELNVQIGDLVYMPLKGRSVAGIVRGITDTSEFKRLQTIESIRYTKFMTSGDIKRLELIAEQILQSPSTVLTSALQGLTHSKSTPQHGSGSKSGSMDKETAKIIGTSLNDNRGSIETSFEGSIVAMSLAVKKAKNQVLVLCPREYDAETISQFLSKPHAKLHGHTSIARRRWIMENWQSGDLKILIGTKQSSLIPAKKIDTVIVFDPQSDDHVSYSRNPRYNARLAAELLADQHKAQIITVGSLSRLEQANDPIHITPRAEAQIINLADSREKTGIPLISETSLDAISNALQNGKKVLISYNCKGVAKHLQCRSCHHIPMCGSCGSKPHVRLDDLVCPVCATEMWIPKACPACNKKTLSTRGIGNKKIADNLQKKFTNAKIQVIDKEHSTDSNADVSIVTEHYFQSIYKPFPENRFELIVELMAEKSLGDNYESSITTAYRLHRIMHMAHHHKAQCIIQTWMPKVIKPMLDSESFLEQENELREQYKLPPYADQFIMSGKLDLVPSDIRDECIEQEGSFLLTTDNKQRKEILKRLKELPDNVTILSKYSKYY